MRNLLLRSGLLLALSALVSSLGCGREAGPSAGRARPSAAAAPAASVGAEPSTVAPEPAQKAANLDGGLVHVSAPQFLAKVRGSGKKATLLNAWASWCGPCRRELPMLQALSANLKPQGVEIVLISVDDARDELKAASYLRDNGITLRSYLADGSIADFKAGINPRWPGMLPASFLFNDAARLVHFWGGEAFENELTPVIEDFLAGKAIVEETTFGLAPGKTE